MILDEDERRVDSGASNGQVRVAAPAASSTIQTPSGLVQRPARHFVGREVECRLFWSELLVPASAGGRFITSIAGVGGIGKSSLLQRLLQVQVGDSICIFLDERTQPASPAELSELVARHLAGGLGPESHTARTLANIRPGRGSRAAPDLEPLLEAELELTDAIIRDVNDLGNVRRQVLLAFDTYEVLHTVVGPWLLESLLGGGLTPITGDLRLVVSGREPIQRTDLRWIREWDSAVLNLDLEPFHEREIEIFLRNGPNTAAARLAPLPTDIHRALHVTGGLPAWLGLWRKRWISAGEPPNLASAEDVQGVVARFLMWWDDPNQRRWVRTAWVPRWFNLDILKVLLGPEAETAFDWLTQQASIVRGVGGRWSFHQVVRTALRVEALQRTPGELAEVNDRLADFWSDRSSPSAAALHEAIYHELLGGDPSRGIVSAYREYIRSFAEEDALAVAAGVIEAVRAAREDAGALVSLADFEALEEHWDAWRSEDETRLAPARERMLALGILEARERALLLAERVPSESPQREAGPSTVGSGPQRRWWSGLRLPGLPERHAPVSPAIEAQVRALVEYGDTLRLAGSYESALKPLGEALALDPRSAHAWASRGETRRVLGQTKEALDDLSTAVRLAPREAWIWVSRATTYLVADMPERALEDADRVLALNVRSAWALAIRGAAMARLSGYLVSEADVSLRRALELDPSLGWALAELTFWEGAPRPEPAAELD